MCFKLRNAVIALKRDPQAYAGKTAGITGCKSP